MLTTSGTAAANLYPAVLEAVHAHQPLVLITASRPRSLINTGANQTTDQDHLFGRHVRDFAAITDQTRRTRRAWRFETARLLSAATGLRTRRPGPVQLNVELSDPLVPTAFDQPPTAPELIITRGRRSGPGGRAVRRPADGDHRRATATRRGVGSREAGRARRGCRCWPSRRATPGPGRRPCPPPGCCRLDARRGDRAGASSSDTRRWPGRSAGCWPGDDLELIMVVGLSGLGRSGSGRDPGRATRSAGSSPRMRDWLAAWQQADASAAERSGRAAGRVSRTSAARPLAGALWASLDRRRHAVRRAPPTRSEISIWRRSATSAPDGLRQSRAGRDRRQRVHRRPASRWRWSGPTHALLGDLTAAARSDRTVLRRGSPGPTCGWWWPTTTAAASSPPWNRDSRRTGRRTSGCSARPHHAIFAALAAGLGCGYQRVSDRDELNAVLAEPPIGIELVEAVIDRAHRRTLNAAITALAATL